MNHTPIHISRDDHTKLRLLLSVHSASSTSLTELREELDRAVIVDPAEIPADIVTMDSTVTFKDLGTSEVEEYTITFPEKADVESRRISILAPIGTALIGCRVGDVVSWSTPGGIRRLKVVRVKSAAPSTPSFSALPPVFAGFHTA